LETMLETVQDNVLIYLNPFPLKFWQQ
jgi:hypothetical protein